MSPQPIFGGSMRDRYQRGRVEERGSRRKKWYGHYFVYAVENGVEVRKH